MPQLVYTEYLLQELMRKHMCCSLLFCCVLITLELQHFHVYFYQIINGTQHFWPVADKVLHLTVATCQGALSQ